MVRLRCSDNWRADVALREEPSQRDLRHRNAALRRDALYDVHDLPIRIGVKTIGVRIVVRACRRALRLVAGTSQHAARDWRPWDDTESHLATQRNHFAF